MSLLELLHLDFNFSLTVNSETGNNIQSIKKPRTTFSVSACLSLLLVLLVVSPAKANSDSDQEMMLSQLQDARIMAFRIGTEYLLFHLTDYDPRFRKSAQTRLDTFHGLMTDIKWSVQNYVEFETLRNLTQSWDKYERLQRANIKTIEVMGESVNSQLEELMKSHAELLLALKQTYGELEESLEVALSPLVSKSRQDALLIESISFLYMNKLKKDTRLYFYSDSTLDMNALCDRFETSLAQMRIGLVEDQRSRRELQQVKIKFDFIEPSLRDHNSRVVPELVNRYSESIVETLRFIGDRKRS